MSRLTPQMIQIVTLTFNHLSGCWMKNKMALVSERYINIFVNHDQFVIVSDGIWQTKLIITSPYSSSIKELHNCMQPLNGWSINCHPAKLLSKYFYRMIYTCNSYKRFNILNSSDSHCGGYIFRYLGHVDIYYSLSRPGLLTHDCSRNGAKWQLWTRWVQVGFKLDSGHTTNRPIHL